MFLNNFILILLILVSTIYAEAKDSKGSTFSKISKAIITPEMKAEEVKIDRDGSSKSKINISFDEKEQEQISSINKGNLKLELNSSEKFKNQILVDKALELAFKAYRAGQISAAMSLYQKVLKEDKFNLNAMFGAASIHHEEGNLSEAKRLYREILDLHPSHVDAINNYIQIISTQSPMEGLKELRKLEAVNQTLAIIPAQISAIYFKMGNYKKAINNIIKALNIEPENLQYKYNLAIALDQYGDRENAVQIYKELLAKQSFEKQDIFSIEEVTNRIDFLTNEGE